MHSHSYFHQVQLQIYFACDLCEWCDFCIYTCKGEHIFPDHKWQENAIPQLQLFFDDFMLPEILPWKYKTNDHQTNISSIHLFTQFDQSILKSNYTIIIIKSKSLK